MRGLLLVRVDDDRKHNGSDDFDRIELDVVGKDRNAATCRIIIDIRMQPVRSNLCIVILILWLL